MPYSHWFSTLSVLTRFNVKPVPMNPFGRSAAFFKQHTKQNTFLQLSDSQSETKFAPDKHLFYPPQPADLSKELKHKYDSNQGVLTTDNIQRFLHVYFICLNP